MFRTVARTLEAAFLYMSTRKEIRKIDVFFCFAMVACVAVMHFLVSKQYEYNITIRFWKVFF